MKIVFNAPKPSVYDQVFSNFVASPVEMDGIVFPTVEHAYQAAKTLDMAERKRIASLPTPGKAKRAGRGVELRPDWEEVKYKIMKVLLYQKFSEEPFKGNLLGTEDAVIVEDASAWNDKIWGVGRDGKGQNLLGRCLMEVRDMLKNE